MKIKNKKFLSWCLVALLIVPFFSLKLNNEDAEACNTAECREAKAKELEASQKAQSASSAANAYQRKVSDIELEISSKETEIKESETAIEGLKAKIQKTEQKIASDQEALAELLVNMHFESDAEPIRILAGASSISDLAEKATREEVAREQISSQAAKIKEEKATLEEDKAQVEAKLTEQQQAREELVAKKQELSNLVAKYQNDMDAYEAVAKEERENYQKAYQAWMAQNASNFNGGKYSGVNTYPWQADCPGKQDYYITSYNGWKIGGYVCECVSYAGWKAYEWYGVALAWGNAYSWDDRARAAGYRVDNAPAAGTIGQVDGYPYGHVFWVESVNADGSINVTEYNNSYATYLYSGNSHYGDFGARTISAGEVGRYNYIHF